MELKDKEFKLRVVIGAGILVAMVLLIYVISLIGGGKGKTKTEDSNKGKKDNVKVTATPVPDVKTMTVEKDAHEEVNNIVKQYFQLSLKGDIENLNKIISDAENVTKEALQKKYEYIEDVKNIECYTLAGPDEGSYVVYAYYEYKFVNINTTAPGMSRFYVCKIEDGSMRILLNQVDDVVKATLDKSEENPSIISLKSTVENKYQEALNGDEQLKKFVESLVKSTEQVSNKAGKDETPKKETKKKEKKK